MKSPLKPYFAEFFGTALLIIFGDGVVAQTILSKHVYGSWLSVNMAWAAAFALSSFLSSPGPTMNPAVTVVLSVFRSNRANHWRSVPGKIVAQLLGAFFGAAIVYALYYNAIDEYENGQRTVPGGSILSGEVDHSTAGIFATYPASFLTMTSAVLSEFLASAILTFGLFAIADKASTNTSPFAVFVLVLAIGAALGWETGYAMNAARDFGPRLLSYLVGYSSEVFTVGPYYYIVPIVVPFAGCGVGALVYDLFLYEGDETANWVQLIRRKTRIDRGEDGPIHLE